MLRSLRPSLTFRQSSAANRHRCFSKSSICDMRIVNVPVRDDNYAYLVIDETSNKAAVVDPYDMVKVQNAAKEQGVFIIASFTTHHHHDHSGGNKARLYEGAPIYGGSDQGSANTIVKDEQEFTVADQLNVKCLHTPCHTQDSICYYITDKSKPSQEGAVFTGDTLFTGGCGRFFEGTAEEMHRALTYLGTLPNETRLYNGHEYTRGNLKFGKTIEPESSGMQRLEKFVEENAQTAGKSTIGDEKDWNVFMRLHIDAVIKAAQVGPDPVKVMDALRDAKNKS